MLNERARAILAFIQRFARERGFPPTIREIGEEFDISSTNGVRYYLNLLERGGYVKRSGKISRGIGIVTMAPPPIAGIPILGRVAAGQPILAEESFEGTLDTSQLFGDPKGMFALRVRGDSMIEAGIFEGDYVIVRHQPRAEPGEMIVALIGDEATVKHYHPRGDRVELRPANQEYEPIVIDKGEAFQILGIVRGVIRTVTR
jgi:repressor LexA